MDMNDKTHVFTVTESVDSGLAGVAARLYSTHPLDMVTLVFIEGSRIQVHLSDIRPLIKALG
jgi:hypothetical protein